MSFPHIMELTRNFIGQTVGSMLNVYTKISESSLISPNVKTFFHILTPIVVF